MSTSTLHKDFKNKENIKGTLSKMKTNIRQQLVLIQANSTMSFSGQWPQEHVTFLRTAALLGPGWGETGAAAMSDQIKEGTSRQLFGIDAIPI